jgi:hypothetical protein
MASVIKRGSSCMAACCLCGSTGSRAHTLTLSPTAAVCGAPRTLRERSFSVHVVFDNDGDGDVDDSDLHYLDDGHDNYTKKALFKEVRSRRKAHTQPYNRNPYTVPRRPFKEGRSRKILTPR